MARVKTLQRSSRKAPRGKKRRGMGIFLLLFFISLIIIAGLFSRDIIGNFTRKIFVNTARSKFNKNLIDADTAIYQNRPKEKKKESENIRENKLDPSEENKQEDYGKGDKDYLNNIINSR